MCNFFFVFIIYLKTIRCRCTAFVLPYPKLFYSANFSKYLLNILSKEIYGILTYSSLYSTHVRKFDLLLIFQPITAQLCSWKEYFPNLLETGRLHQFFVFRVREFWLLAYYLSSFNCAKVQQDWTTMILDLL